MEFVTYLSKNKNNFYFWSDKIEILLKQYNFYTTTLKQNLNKYLRNYTKIRSYTKQNELGKLYLKYFTHNDQKKIINKYNNLNFFFFKIFAESFFKILHCYLIHNFMLFNKFQILKLLVSKINLIYFKYNYKLSVTHVWKIPSKYVSNQLLIDISKKQLNITLTNDYLMCFWTCSAGLILIKLNLKEQKYLKKTKNFWPILFKTLSKKIEILNNSNVNQNFLVIKGQHKYFLKLILLLWKLKILENYNYIIFKLNLPFCLKKIKKIKAIKRKLTKRFLKLELQQNIEFKKLKKQTYSSKLN